MNKKKYGFHVNIFVKNVDRGIIRIKKKNNKLLS